MPIEGENLLELTDLFQQLGAPPQYIKMFTDPTGYFDVPGKYERFFPDVAMLQKNLSDILGDMPAREEELTGQVKDVYGLGIARAGMTRDIGTERAEDILGIGTERAETGYDIGTRKAEKGGWQSLLGLTGKIGEKIAGAGVAGFGKLKALLGTGTQAVGQTYQEQVGELGTQYEQSISDIGKEWEQVAGTEGELGTKRDIGLFKVQEEMSRIKGLAQTFLGQYIQQFLGLGQNIYASLPTEMQTGAQYDVTAAETGQLGQE